MLETSSLLLFCSFIFKNESTIVFKLIAYYSCTPSFSHSTGAGYKYRPQNCKIETSQYKHSHNQRVRYQLQLAHKGISQQYNIVLVLKLTLQISLLFPFKWKMCLLFHIILTKIKSLLCLKYAGIIYQGLPPMQP